MKRSILVLWLLMVLWLCLPGAAGAADEAGTVEATETAEMAGTAVAAGEEMLQPGQPAPEFNVQSPDGSHLTLNDVQGRTTVIFYEDKDLAPRTTAIKERLGRFMAKFPNRMILLNILDCSEANWITRPFWKMQLDKAGKKNGQTLWADWQAAMVESYGLKKGDSNVVIIDAEGKVRFIQRGDVLHDFQRAEAEETMAQCAKE